MNVKNTSVLYEMITNTMKDMLSTDNFFQSRRQDVLGCKSVHRMNTACKKGNERELKISSLWEYL